MRVLILVVALAVLPVAAGAQAARSISAPVSSMPTGVEIRMQQANGPTVQSAAVGIQLAPSPFLMGAKPRRRSGVDHNVALMIVGVGAMVAGSFMNGTAGTVFIVGGAVVGLYGLFNYVQ